MPVRGGGDDETALPEADWSKNVDDSRGQFRGVVLQLQHGGGIESRGVVERNFLDVFSRGPTFDLVDSAEHTAAWRPADQQTGAQPHLANELPRNDQVALGRSQGMDRIAQLPIPALLGKLEDAFNVSVDGSGGLRLLLGHVGPLLLVEVPSVCRSIDRPGSRRMHDLSKTL